MLDGLVLYVYMRFFSGPYFPALGLNTERYIQSECGKIRTRKNYVFGSFSRSVFYKILCTTAYETRTKAHHKCIKQNIISNIKVKRQCFQYVFMFLYFLQGVFIIRVVGKVDINGQANVCLQVYC